MQRQKSKRVKFSSCSDDEYDGYMTYRPLSNLPTPPPSLSSAAQSPKNPLEDGERLKTRYLGPAIHLVNLIPSAASLATPSVPLVQAILSRSDLPLESIALAVCVLDALDNRFALSWRLSCPLHIVPPIFACSNKRHTLPSGPFEQQLHIDSVYPELIILSALTIAVKFLDDPQASTRYYCSAWGGDIWSCEQLNATERCIMENLNYRILPLCDEDLLTDAMVDMQLAVRQGGRQYGGYDDEEYRVEMNAYPSPADESDEDDVDETCESGSSKSKHGKPVVGLGLNLTPAETPPS
ncbi:hypothetical protein jhhlp_004391 [Lomentospora prolificans]|uniref:Cyclin N-terminal domain-containing protein n=1 Tax=Lomentospora prolificans TaxID=41688 RepID=A0A2N3NBG2_9PEZI|nr:hypothetical protein jhhlp_004391 [Lomentospora prolificans]